MSSQVQKVKSRLSSRSNTWQSHPYITLPFIFVKFTLITDSIAVASNNCAKDCLHIDCCVQAFGRNTLSKPHNWLPQRGTALYLWHPYSIHNISSDLQGQHLSLPHKKCNNPYLTCVLHHSLGSHFSSYFQINFKFIKNLWKWYYWSSIHYFGFLNSTSSIGTCG